MRIVMVGAFGLRIKMTLTVRALPLAQALAERGHTVTLLTPPWDSPSDAGRVYKERGVRIENVAVSRRAAIPLHLARRALALRPDVVHVFKPKAYAGLAGLFLENARRLGAPRLRLIMDTDDWEGAGGWNDQGHYSWLQKHFFAWQEQYGLRHSDAVTVASRALETIAWSLGIPREKVHYLPNGARPGIERRYTVNADAPPTVLLLTRFVEFQVPRLVQILRGIRETCPSVRFVVVGKGLNGEDDVLRRLAREAGIADALDARGWVEPEELPRFYDEADLALFPSDDTLINRCKCSVKLVDLLSAGMPVVAEAVGQNAEYIEHGASGWLVSPGRTEEFAQAVVRLLQEPERRERLGVVARQRLQNEFSWARLAEVAERAYSQDRPPRRADS